MEPVVPEIRAAMRATGGVPSVSSVPSVPAVPDLEDFVPEIRAGRQLSDLLLCSFVLFLSGTAFHY